MTKNKKALLDLGMFDFLDGWMYSHEDEEKQQLPKLFSSCFSTALAPGVPWHFDFYPYWISTVC